MRRSIAPHGLDVNAIWCPPWGRGRAGRVKPGQAHRLHKDLHRRIEHASVVAPQDAKRFGSLGIVAAVQAISCLSDGQWLIERLGKARARERAFAFQRLRGAGAVLANGSDTPVEDVYPLPGFYASVTCALQDGTVFWPEQRMSRGQALRAYTLDCARAAFQEHIVGSITPGKLADVAVLSADIMSIPAEEILGAEVTSTILGGRIVHQTEK